MDDLGAKDTAELPATSPARWGGRVVILLLLGTLLALGYLVLQNFLIPIVWATILAYLTWPLNRRLSRVLHNRRGWAAGIMTLILTVAIILPLILVIVSLRTELQDAMDAFRAIVTSGPGAVPPAWRDIPLFGPWLVSVAERIAADPDAVGDWIARQAPIWAGEAATVAGIIGRNAMKFAFALIAVFFFYRDGERLIGELRRGLHCLLGNQSKTYWDVAAGMTQAVVYGLVLTALAQGALAGIGYWITGVGAPVLIGALTALFALIPFGAPIVWGAAALWLFWQGDWWAALALVAWGALLVSSVDNVVRPLVISASAHISFLLVLFGVLGGLAAFGLVGLFLGPVVLVVLWAVWRNWLELNTGACAEDLR